MSRIRRANFSAKLAGAIVCIGLAVGIPVSHLATGVAQAETVCLAPQHNDPWIGCIG